MSCSTSRPVSGSATVRPSTRSAGLYPGSTVAERRRGKSSPISRPTICRMTSFFEVSATGAVEMVVPSRSTVMRSAMAKTSSSLCEM